MPKRKPKPKVEAVRAWAYVCDGRLTRNAKGRR